MTSARKIKANHENARASTGRLSRDANLRFAPSIYTTAELIAMS